MIDPGGRSPGSEADLTVEELDVAIYSGALTANRVLAHYNARN